MTRCLLAVGANLGDRALTLHKAAELIAALPKTQLLARSTWHETLPVGGPAGQESFFNGAILIDTSLAPHELATALQGIERQLGRNRHVRWDARTIDIDILLFGEQTIHSADLEIPHPRMSFRQFVLAPAAEIAGEMVHPATGWTVAALLHHLQNAPRTVAVIADDANTESWLKSELERELGTDPAGGRAVKLVDANAADGDRPGLTIFVGTCGRCFGPALHVAMNDRAAIHAESLAALRAAWPQ